MHSKLESPRSWISARFEVVSFMYDVLDKCFTDEQFLYPHDVL